MKRFKEFFNKSKKEAKIKIDSNGQISYYYLNDVDINQFVKPFDKKIAKILTKEYSLPYKIETVIDGIETKHNINGAVIKKSLDRLHKVRFLTLRRGLVFVEGGKKNKEWVGK